ncbi:hypothetical protein Tcan_01866 [Toxocara canis]|uniref:Uncharacterized protein n=1 Tax=Toxocara canis TaxID=6265 RepID=A0A0B2VXT0_TOXCA|nr:hypothetical protein Tcan_01866 [Toxocara canis]
MNVKYTHLESVLKDIEKSSSFRIRSLHFIPLIVVHRLEAINLKGMSANNFSVSSIFSNLRQVFYEKILMKFD